MVGTLRDLAEASDAAASSLNKAQSAATKANPVIGQSASALALLFGRFAGQKKKTNEVKERPDLGTDEEQLARRLGGGTSLPSSVRPAPSGELTREERDRRAREARENRERDAGESPEKDETVNAFREIRSFRVKARSEFVAAVDGALEDLGDAGDDVVDYIGDAGDEYVEEFANSADEFGNLVRDAADELSGVSQRVLDDLRQLSSAAGSGSFASEGFNPEDEGGQKTGGAISNTYLNQLIDDYNRLVEANERYARGEGSTAARARNQVLNNTGMNRLEDLWERIASRFARLEDLARERRRQKRSRSRSKSRGATPRTNRSQLP